MPNALLVYPELPPSYWSEKYALDFIAKKASMPPLGLLTLAALFPAHYRLKVLDMNVEPLTDKLLAWCDYVFCSAMIVQQSSFKEVLKRCNDMHVPLVAGGPYPTSFHDELSGVDYFVLGEVEDYFAEFLADLEQGRARHLYQPPKENGRVIRPSIEHTPAPRYDLIDLNNYASVSVQFSRGCPYNCEFCDITKLYGRVPRTKTPAQMLSELQLLYDCGWRRSVFFVDDNFIGNRAHAKKLLPQVAKWQRERKYPFSFYTEASVNIAEMPDLLDDMAEAGFDMVFLGLETPNIKALLQADKAHNVKADQANYLLHAVRTIQRHGLEVSGGFIIGLDGDDESAFDAQIDFIQEAGIATAMVGLLTALKGTKLYQRFKAEGRLLDESAGNNMSATLNFIPKINRDVLLEGYKRVLSTIYDSSLRNYFARSYTLLKNWQQRTHCARPLGKDELLAFMRSIRRQLFSRQGPAYFSFLLKTLLRRPRMFSEAIRLAILGYHYQKVTRQQVIVDEFRAFLDTECKKLQEKLAYYATLGSEHLSEAKLYLNDVVEAVKVRYQAINMDFRLAVKDTMSSFEEGAKEYLEKLSSLWSAEMRQKS